MQNTDLIKNINAKFIKIDCCDENFNDVLLESIKRIIFDIQNKNNKNNDSLYNRFNEFIKTNGVSNFKKVVVYKTYLLHCASKVTSHYIANTYSLNNLDALNDLSSKIEINFEEEQSILNNDYKTCYIDLIEEKVYLV